MLDESISIERVPKQWTKDFKSFQSAFFNLSPAIMIVSSNVTIKLILYIRILLFMTMETASLTLFEAGTPPPVNQP